MKICLQYHHLLPFFRKVDAYGVVYWTKTRPFSYCKIGRVLKTEKHIEKREKQTINSCSFIEIKTVIVIVKWSSFALYAKLNGDMKKCMYVVNSVKIFFVRSFFRSIGFFQLLHSTAVACKAKKTGIKNTTLQHYYHSSDDSQKQSRRGKGGRQRGANNKYWIFTLQLSFATLQCGKK